MSAEIVLLAIVGAVVGQSRAVGPSPDAGRQERLQFLKEKGAEFSLFREAAKEPLLLKEEPVLRYSIPERDNGTWDGATFLWLEDARPVAAISLGIRRPDDKVVFEHTSFSGTPLVCRREGAAVWSPQTGGLLNRPLDNASPPAETAAARLTQMRALVRRFSATCYWGADVTQLRLLPQPIYRFADEKEGVLDGALFAMVVSNDPELFVLLEATSKSAGGKPGWQFSLARMSSLKHTVRLDENEIWSIPSFYRIPPAERKTSPYIEGPLG